jgi:uncharacterized membrane protein
MAGPGEGLEHGGSDLPVDQSEIVDGAVGEGPNGADVVRILAERAFSGPLPPPEILAQYNHAAPEGGNRIMKMAEDQSAHRRQIERRGQIFAFLLAFLAIAGGIGLIADGKSAEGLVPLVAALGGLLGVFIYGEIQSRKERRRPANDDG